MAVIIKSSNSAFLKKVGIPDNIIESLKANGIKLSLGYKEFAFVSSDNLMLANGSLPTDSNTLMKGLASPDLLADAHTVLSGAITLALTKNVTGGGEKFVSAHLNVKPEVTKPKSVMPPSVKINPASVLSAYPIALRDAEVMYQKVKGTSGGSVYVVVALSEHVKIAARITGSNLSVRAEGEFSQLIKGKLASQAIIYKDKGDYASGHFECGDKVPVERVMGSILVGLGMQFDTPIPDMTKVKSLCS